MNIEHSRAHIQLLTMRDIDGFVSALNRDGSSDRYTIENFDGTLRINARSLNGVIYAAMDYNAQMYLVNETHDGVLPSAVDMYRV